MTQKRIQILEHSPAQQAVSGIVETLPTHADGLRVILESDQKIYTSHQGSWIVDIPQEGWRSFLNFPGIEVVYKGGEWVEDISILDATELPSTELPSIELPSVELDKDFTDKHFEIPITNTDEVVIGHGLNKKPSVTIINSEGNVVIANVEHLTNNNCKISFSDLFTGTVIFN